MMTREDRISQRRLMVINLVRLAAVAIAAVGVANIGGRLWPEYRPLLGQIIFCAGIAFYFIAPVLLKRMWRSPKP